MDSGRWECEKRWQISLLAKPTRPVCQLVIPTRGRRQPRSSSLAAGGDKASAHCHLCLFNQVLTTTQTQELGGRDGGGFMEKKRRSSTDLSFFLFWKHFCFSRNHSACNHVWGTLIQSLLDPLESAHALVFNRISHVMKQPICRTYLTTGNTELQHLRSLDFFIPCKISLSWVNTKSCACVF